MMDDLKKLNTRVEFMEQMYTEQDFAILTNSYHALEKRFWKLEIQLQKQKEKIKDLERETRILRDQLNSQYKGFHTRIDMLRDDMREQNE